MRLFGLARALNEARSATLQARGWEAATRERFCSGRVSLEVLVLPGVKINDS